MITRQVGVGGSGWMNEQHSDHNILILYQYRVRP